MNIERKADMMKKINYSILVALASLMLLEANSAQAAPINPPTTPIQEHVDETHHSKQEIEISKTTDLTPLEVSETTDETAENLAANKENETTKEDKAAQNSSETSQEETSNQAAIVDAAKEGIHVNGSQIIDENNQRASNWVAIGSKIVDNEGQVVNGLKVDRQSGAVLATDTNTQVNRQTVYDVLEVSEAKQKPVFLPATGDKSQRLTLFGGVFVGVASLLGFAIIDHRSKSKLAKDIQMN